MFHGRGREFAPWVTHQAERVAERTNPIAGLARLGMLPAAEAALTVTAAAEQHPVLGVPDPRAQRIGEPRGLTVDHGDCEPYLLNRGSRAVIDTGHPHHPSTGAIP